MKFLPARDYPSYRSKLLDDFRRSRERSNTRKQDEWVEEVKKTGDLTASSLKVYNDRPSTIIKRNMAKPSIRDEVDKLMDDTGCGTRNALQVIGDSMKAEKPGYVTKEGEVIEGSPDYRIRMDAAKETLKLKDAYPKGTTTHDHRHLHAIMVQEYSKLPFDELTNMMKAEIMATQSEEQQEQQEG